MAGDFFDDKESRSVEQRDSDLFGALPGQLGHAKSLAPFYTDLLADVDTAAVTDRASLAALPLTRKSALEGKQKDRPPFGGLAAVGPDIGIARIFQSPGPLYEPQGATNDYFRVARAMYAAGFRPGDVVHNTFSYHLTPGGFIMDSGARALGCPIIPAGVGNTEQQLDVIADIKPMAYVGTPSFLKILLEKADADGRRLSFRKAFVGGEYFPPPLRDALQERGILAYQGYATADLGSIAYESSAVEGMIVDEDIIVEIVRPGTGDPVPEGEVGEVIVTLFSKEFPLVRYATGDLSAVLAGESPCGRTNMRLKGWMGRADQATKVKGMFVRPSQIADIVKRHDAVAKARLVVQTLDGRDAMTLHCEVAGGDDALAAALADTVQAVCKVKGAISLTDPGSLPNDGIVIEDTRTYD